MKELMKINYISLYFLLFLKVRGIINIGFLVFENKNYIGGGCKRSGGGSFGFKFLLF